MADNSDKRKKAFLISVLAFLFAGGGVFLFFIVQGSNDLTGKGKNKNFSYGTAAREGVSSFFKSVGIFPQEDEALSASAVDRLETRGLPLEDLGITPPSGDISDWMAKDSSRASSASAPKGGSGSPTKVPKMGMKAMAGVGRGGGSSKSAGSVSRFGAGSQSGETSVSSKAGGGSGTTDKATLASLKNARAMLGQGLRSGSAQTAKDKWGQSFGVGGKASGGNLAYNKGGMVSLDKIKSGEISSLKMDSSKSLTTPDVTSPVKDTDGTKAALSQDAEVKKNAEAELKKKMAEELIKGVGDGVEKGMQESQQNSTGEKPDGKPEGMPQNVWDTINQTTCGDGAGCTTGGGAAYTDTSRVLTKNSDGTWNCEFAGTQTNPDGTVIEYTDKVTYGADGIPIDILVTEKAAG